MKYQSWKDIGVTEANSEALLTERLACCVQHIE